MRIVDRRGHQLRRLGTGIAEHDPLIAGPLLLTVRGVDPDRNMRRLFVQEVRHLDGLVVELLLRVADVADAVPRDAVDPAHHLRQARRVGQPDLAADHDPVGRREGLGGHPRLGLLREQGVEDGVGNAIAYLVRMPLGDGFRGEGIVLAAAHGGAPIDGHAPSGSRWGDRYRLGTIGETHNSDSSGKDDTACRE